MPSSSRTFSSRNRTVRQAQRGRDRENLSRPFFQLPRIRLYRNLVPPPLCCLCKMVPLWAIVCAHRKWERQTIKGRAMKVLTVLTVKFCFGLWAHEHVFLFHPAVLSPRKVHMLSPNMLLPRLWKFPVVAGALHWRFCVFFTVTTHTGFVKVCEQK